MRERSEVGTVLSTSGRHPDLGRVVAVQDGASVFLLTERALSFGGLADTYVLETAIARIVQARKTLEACQARPEREPELANHPSLNGAPEKDVSQLLRGMLTWLGIDPVTATAREIAYAREAVAYVHGMAALAPGKLVELHTALVNDMKNLQRYKQRGPTRPA